MKMTRLFAALIGVIVGLSCSAWAAPVASVESSRASIARQKLDAFLSEKAVTKQLTALGVSQERVNARLAQLSDAQLQQLAAQVDLIRAGGTIQGAGLNPAGPLGHMGEQLRVFLQDLYQLLFSWTARD